MGTTTRVGDGGSSVAVADAAAETMRRIVDCCRSDMVFFLAVMHGAQPVIRLSFGLDWMS